LFDAASVTVDKTQYPQVGGSTFETWGHTEVAITDDATNFEVSKAGRDMVRSQNYQNQELTDPETFTPEMVGGSYWHVNIGTEGSTPGTPAYTIANPSDSTINASSPGLNSGIEIWVQIENGSGYSLTDANFTWGSEFSALALPTIPNGERVFAKFMTGGRAISSSEKIWQVTDWVVH
jgi:hypothetical protein